MKEQSEVFIELRKSSFSFKASHCWNHFVFRQSDIMAVFIGLGSASLF